MCVVHLCRKPSTGRHALRLWVSSIWDAYRAVAVLWVPTFWVTWSTLTLSLTLCNSQINVTCSAAHTGYGLPVQQDA